MIDVTNQAIVAALEETFGIPVYYANVPADKLKNYNYFILTEGRTTRAQSPALLKQEVLINFVSEHQNDLKELSIAKRLEKMGLFFQECTVAHIQKGDTDNFIDVVSFIFTRPVKYEC